jgi:sulfotransferase
MTRRIHFISGLPRAGSTLLAAVLRQNPRFHAAMTSPVAWLTFTLRPEMSAPAQFASAFDDDRRRAMLRGLFDAYYAGIEREVIFDTNRVWTGNLALLADLHPQARVICCVREVNWIIDSIERLVQANPLQTARIFPADDGKTVFSRVERLMHPEIGLIGAAWSNLRQAWFGEHADRLLLVSYEGFVQDPRGAIDAIYRALGEPSFAHDCNAVSYDAAEYDAELGMPGLHRVRPRIERATRAPIIPPEIFKKFASMAFWKTQHERPCGPSIIC